MQISINGLSIATVISELRFNMRQDRAEAQRFTDIMMQHVEAFRLLAADQQAEEKCIIMGIDFAPALTAYLPIEVSAYNRAARIAYNLAATADTCITDLRQQGERCLHDLQNEFTTSVYVDVDDLTVEEIFISLYLNAEGDSADIEAKTAEAWGVFKIKLDQAVAQQQWDSAALTTLDIDFAELYLNENEDDQLLNVTTYNQKMLAQGKKTAEACIEILYQHQGFNDMTSQQTRYSYEYDNHGSRSAMAMVVPPVTPVVKMPPTITSNQLTSAFNPVEPFQLEVLVTPGLDQRQKTLSGFFKSSRT